MAKRFTDTDKWKRPWFNSLDFKAKFFWTYMLDTCDNRGVWLADFRLATFQVGFKVTESDVIKWFGDKIRRIDADKFFIPSFVDFQYGVLSEKNNAHKPVIKLLNDLKLRGTLGPQEPLGSPSGGAQDKDKDKDKDSFEESARETFNPRKLAELWNEIMQPIKGEDGKSSMPLVDLDCFEPKQERVTSAKARLAEKPERSYWERVIHRIATSPFCRGRNDRAWLADFAFLVRPETHLKVMEGKYDARTPTAAKAPLKPGQAAPIKYGDADKTKALIAEQEQRTQEARRNIDPSAIKDLVAKAFGHKHGEGA